MNQKEKPSQREIKGFVHRAEKDRELIRLLLKDKRK